MIAHHVVDVLRAAMVRLLSMQNSGKKKSLLDGFDEATLNDLGFSRRIDFDCKQNDPIPGYYVISDEHESRR